MKKLSVFLLAFILMLSLSACGKPPKETLGDAFIKSETMKSYNLHMKAKLGVELPPSQMSDEQNAQVASMLENSELQIDGVYQKEPLQAEMTMQINLKGDMNVGINIPLVITKEKVWVKVPSVPFLPIPKTITGKFLELDLKEMEKMSGGSNFDTEKYKELSKELLTVLSKNFDEKTYFKAVDKKEITLPTGANANKFIQVQINQTNFDDTIKVTVSKVIPQIFDLLSDPKWSDLIGSNKEEIDNARNEFNKNSSDVEKVISDVKENLAINNITLISGINKSDYITYQSFVADVDLKDKNETGKFTLNLESSYDHIDEKSEFKIGIPSGDQVITLDQMNKQLGGLK